MIEFILIPFICTIGLLWKIHYLTRIKSYKGRVIAKVTDVKENVYYLREGGVHCYHPTYQYSVNGIIYEKISLQGYRDRLRYPLGSEVVICYDEKNPRRSEVGGKMEDELRRNDLWGLTVATDCLWLLELLCIYLRLSSGSGR